MLRKRATGSRTSARRAVARLEAGFLRGAFGLFVSLRFVAIGWVSPTGSPSTLGPLEQRSGVSARTLRHWIRQKLLPKPTGRGRGARYDDRHVVRAVVARQLRSTRASLPAIRTRIASLSDAELQALAQSEARAASMSAGVVPSPPLAPSYPSTPWQVVTLVDGLVLMVNTTKGPLVRRIADDIYRYYGSPT
jgi:hypothetical protein